MSGKLIFYDLPSKGRCACWSLNPWKIRLALNYLGVEYETQWVEYPDIAPKFRATGLSPNKEGMAYTIPTVQFPDTSILQDSLPIARRLDHEHKLHLDNPAADEAAAAVGAIWKSLFPLVVPQIPQTLLNPRSAEYFETTRAERFGMSLAELERTGDHRAMWREAQSGMEQVKDLLTRDQAGPFVLGASPSWADFVIVGALQCFRRADEKVFERVVGFHDSFGGLYRACGTWLERDDY